jgi:PAP2 superfamily
MPSATRRPAYPATATTAVAVAARAAGFPRLPGAIAASVRDPAVRSLAAMWLVAGLVAGIDLLGARAAGLRIVGLRMTADALQAGLGMAVLCRAFQHFGERLGFDLIAAVFSRTARFFHVVSLVAILSAGFVVLSYLAVAAHMPASDATLARLDALLGFDWLAWFDFVHRHFWMQVAFSYIYKSTQFATPAALIYLVLANRQAYRYHEMLWVFIIAAIATIAICALAPAVHALTYFAMKVHHATRLQLLPFWTKRGLYAGQISAINLSHLTGVVSFPSFHAALVIIFCYALRGTRLFRPALAVGAATLLTLPSVGGHYLVDIPGGAGVALIAIVVVRRWLPDLPARLPPAERGRRLA